MNSSLTVHIYVDASYHPTRGIGYGFVVFNHNRSCILHQKSNPLPNATYKESTNCGGELIGVIKAILWAEQNDFKFIHIYHDYSGTIGLTHHKRPGHRYALFNFYKEFIRKRLTFSHPGKPLIMLRKVKSHSGILGNEIADKLARATINRPMRTTWTSLLVKWYHIAQHSLPVLQFNDWCSQRRSA